jgi:hypothetical protein
MVRSAAPPRVSNHVAREFACYVVRSLGKSTMYTLFGIGLLVVVALLSKKEQRKGAWLMVAAVVVLAVIAEFVR